MALKNTILGWFRGARQTEGVEAAEAEAVEEEISTERADSQTELLLGARPSELEGDRDAPDPQR